LLFVALLVAVLAPAPVAFRAVAPAPAAAQQMESKVDLVRQAFGVIYTGYFNPVNAAGLLNAAWDAATAAVAAGNGAAARAGNSAPPRRPDVSGDSTEALNRFDAAYRLLEAATALDPTQLAYGTIRGMTRFIDNCHTGFLTQAQAAARQAQINGNTLVGPGYIRQVARPWVLLYIVPGGPADLAGLQAGDTILAYDGDGSDGAPATHMKSAGETTVYTVQRPGEDAPRDVSVVIGSYRFPQIETRVIDGDVGYIRFFSWQGGGGQAQAIRDAIAGFEAQGVRGWVLDVRANGGGVAGSAIANLFLPAGPYMHLVTRSGQDVPYVADGTLIVPQRPLAILVGSGSGSDSEIVPEVLREAGRAVLIGSHTPGCMAFSADMPLADGSVVVLTVGHALLGGAGQDFDGIGIEPDIEASPTPDDLVAGRDPGLDAAVSYVEGAGPLTPNNGGIIGMGPVSDN
jgi:carboxyl-terminal processing protease